MAKYRFELQEVFYHTYEIDVPDDLEGFEVDEYFYDLSEEDQKKGLIVSESFTWEITNSEKIEE